MTENDAFDELSLMVAADSEPTLDGVEIQFLLDRARRPDTYGLVYGDTGWTETWDLRAAASEGWMRKAGKVAGKFDFGSDGQSFSRSQIHDMCLKMATLYRRGTVTSVAISSAYTLTTDIVGNVNDG